MIDETQSDDWQDYRTLDKQFVRERFEEALRKREKFYTGPFSVKSQSAKGWVRWYLNDERRAQINSEVWRGEFPVRHVNSEGEVKVYESPADAVGKLVFDAVFYYRDSWEYVREIASESRFTNF